MYLRFVCTHYYYYYLHNPSGVLAVDNATYLFTRDWWNGVCCDGVDCAACDSFSDTCPCRYSPTCTQTHRHQHRLHYFASAAPNAPHTKKYNKERLCRKSNRNRTNRFFSSSLLLLLCVLHAFLFHPKLCARQFSPPNDKRNRNEPQNTI